MKTSNFVQSVSAALVSAFTFASVAFAAPTATVELSASVENQVAKSRSQSYPNEVSNNGTQYFQYLNIDAKTVAVDGAEIQSVEVFATTRNDGSKRVFFQAYSNNEVVRQTGMSKHIPLVCYFGPNSAANSVAVRMQVTVRTRDEGTIQVIKMPVSADQFLTFEKLPLESRARPNSAVCSN